MHAKTVAALVPGAEKNPFYPVISGKPEMGKFDKYSGLFAEQGDFDIPMNFSLGIALTPNSQWTIAADYQRIYYSQIASVRLGAPSS